MSNDTTKRAGDWVSGLTDAFKGASEYDRFAALDNVIGSAFEEMEEIRMSAPATKGPSRTSG